MTAHATAKINSTRGTFVPGDPLVDVPDATVAAWVAGGVAAYEPEAVPDALAPAPAADEAEVPKPAAAPRKSRSRKP